MLKHPFFISRDEHPQWLEDAANGSAILAFGIAACASAALAILAFALLTS